MKKHLTLLQVFTLIFIACSNSKPVDPKPKNSDTTALEHSTKTPDSRDSIKEKENWDKHEQSFKLNNYLVSSLPNNDFLVIDKNSAILISPDTIQIEAMKKEYGEESFYIVADDNIYYQYEASEFLKKKSIPIIYPTNRFLKFITANKNFHFDTKAKATRGWTALLFRTDSMPKIINTVDIEAEYNSYFGH